MTFLFSFSSLLYESDVGNDLGADLGVQALGEFCTLHGEFLLEDWGTHFNEEGLVTDIGIAYIAGDAVTKDFFKGFHELELVVRGLEPFLAEELLNEGSYFFCVTFSHLWNGYWL